MNASNSSVIKPHVINKLANSRRETARRKNEQVSSSEIKNSGIASKQIVTGSLRRNRNHNLNLASKRTMTEVQLIGSL
jgi:hypothetical protein